LPSSYSSARAISTSVYAPDIAPDSDNPERSRYDEVLLTARLEQALRRINPGIAPDVLQTALKEVQRIQ
jgi:type I restriction enzyme, R subunit